MMFVNLGQLSDIVFAKGEFKEINFVIDSGWEDLFDMFTTLFMQGCMRCAKRIVYDDLLDVKERMRQIQVVCKLEQMFFDHDPQPSFAVTAFRKILGVDLSSSFLEVLGDAVYRVKFVPTPQPVPFGMPGCIELRSNMNG